MNILSCGSLGEAMQIKKIILFLLLIPSIIFSQNISELRSLSDEDLRVYWVQAQEEGYSLDQLKTIANAQGLTEIEIAELENRILALGNLESVNKSSNENRGESSSKFGLSQGQQFEFPNQIVFGSSFFNNPSISSAPSLNIATPESYELGPGDELAISIWGAAQNEYTSKITREGYLKIERIGPVYLSGLSISEAKIKLKNSLSKIYSGINSSFNKVFFDITLLNNRSIVINITGNVLAPGAYTLSSLANPLNALYAAGGPNENGSYREIKIIRGEKEVRSLDLYDYFIKGALKSFSLRDQDIILVPTYKKRVVLAGEFKTKGIFELKENESVSDLLLYNGGITSSGVKNTILIKRVEGLSKRIETVEKERFEDYILKDGDIIEARKVGDEVNNAVYIEGPVMIPGQYELNKNLDVRSLIKSAGGLKKSALTDRAYLIREVDGFQQKVISIDLKKSMSQAETYKLKANDNLIIPSSKDLNSSKYISISGEVNEPGSFPFFDGSTIVDLILMAKGITDKGSTAGVTIYRSTYDKSQKNPVETINIDLGENFTDLSSNQNIKLKVNDLVVVRSKLGYQSKEFVSVKGLVKKEGNYALKTNNYSVFDLIKDFGGFLPDAELSGVKIKRKSNLELLESQKNKTDIELNEFIEIGVNINKILSSEGKLNQYNLVLKNGDQIIVPRFDNSIETAGEIQQPTAITYYRGLTTISAINKSGGFAPSAKKSALYVVYQNGEMKSTKSFLIFRKYPKLEPGCKIFVPKKPESKTKTSVGEVVGYTTSLVSIIALIKSL